MDIELTKVCLEEFNNCYKRPDVGDVRDDKPPASINCWDIYQKCVARQFKNDPEPQTPTPEPEPKPGKVTRGNVIRK